MDWIYAVDDARKQLREVSDREAERATALAASAYDAGQGILSRVLSTAAGLAIAAASSDDPVTAVRRLRTDSALLTAIEGAGMAAQRQAFALITEAIVAGFLDDANWRGHVVEQHSPGIKFTTTITAADRDFLCAYPVLGHQPSEIAARLAATLRYDIDGALAAALVGGTDARGIPVALADVARTHATRVGSAVRESYFAGSSASMRALGEALTSPPKKG